MEPGDSLSIVSVRGTEFISSDVYRLPENGLLVCEGRTGLARRLVLAGTSFDEVVIDDVVVENCWLDIAVSPDGIVCYSNVAEIRRLVPIESGD
jgi:hypothetical protein